jgi:cytochrome c553
MNIKNIISLIGFLFISAGCSHSQDKPVLTSTKLNSMSVEPASQSANSLETVLDNGVSLGSVMSTCAACHSVNGLATNSQWPNLAGQNVDYLILQLTAFRDGHRLNALMPPGMLGDLSDQDLKQLSLYYSSLPSADYKDETEVNVRDLPGAHVRARCVSCHGMSGNAVTSLWPNIAGQNAGYLAKQLRDYKSGRRKHPIMEVIGGELNEQQIIDVADYYSLAK